MDTQSTKFKVRLGIFISTGIILFVLGIFYIGRQKNLFNPVFKITTSFYSVSGLQVGNNVRFSGINLGTVDNIQIINDTTVNVEIMMDKDVQKFIKNDCIISIGSEGIIGDRVLNISQGSPDAKPIKDGEFLSSVEPVETDQIMMSLQIASGNAEIITNQLAEIMVKINSGNGTLGRLIQDTTIAENLSETIKNLKTSSKGLDENMKAAKHNFLLKGYFNKKEKEKQKQLEKEKAKKEAVKKENAEHSEK